MNTFVSDFDTSITALLQQQQRYTQKNNPNHRHQKLADKTGAKNASIGRRTTVERKIDEANREEKKKRRTRRNNDRMKS